MRAAFALVLLVGLALAGGAAMMVQNRFDAYKSALAHERANRGQAIATVDVLVATEPLKYGQQLSKNQVASVKWPQASLPEGTFQTLDALFISERPEDERVVLRAIEPGEAILSVKVTRPGEDAGITSRLERGMRAFAIKVDVSSGVSGFLRPGDSVDVYWTGRIPDQVNGNRGDVTRLIQPNIELIAVDQKAGDVNQAVIARTVTVAARPEQVAALAQAQSTGRLSLSLVGAQDDTIAELVEVDQRTLLGLSDIQAPAPAQQKRVCTIRNRRGAEVVVTEIPCTN
ncbi:Flp pilus assembly protein CpaB [Epibacterium ulvae]|uniref:Flp pilus assembly protein CpaB n=1 Tax=Epibacterium ulvae TaxID=1156985 RepID=UPI002490474F|nr:Flp pilus assembly protein CpaB [Epibacterium ulvae]